MFRRALFLVAFVVVPGAARADCPLTDVQCGSGAFSSSALPQGTQACNFGSSGSFDVLAGRLELDLPNDATDPGESVTLTLRDDYTVRGLGPGEPYTLRLRVYVTGTAFSSGGFGDGAGVLVTLGPTSPVAGDFVASRSFGTTADVSGTVALDDSVDVTVSRTAGLPVGITIKAGASAHNGRVIAHLRYRFVEFGRGRNLTSCKGYVQEDPVPAAVASWGRLKAAYR